MYKLLCIIVLIMILPQVGSALTLDNSYNVNLVGPTIVDSLNKISGGTLSLINNGYTYTPTTAPTNTNGILPWMVINDSSLPTPLNWAVANGDSNSLTSLTSYSTGAYSTWTATTNARPPTGSYNIQANISANSLILDNGVNPFPQGGRKIITLTSGGIFQTGGTSTLVKQFDGYSRILQLMFGTAEGIIYTVGDLRHESESINTSYHIDGSGGITKSGAGMYWGGYRSDTNIYLYKNTNTGPLTINEGTWRVQTTHTQGLGAGTLVLNGGIVDIYSGTELNFARNTTVNNDAKIISGRHVAGSGLTYTLGTLEIGNKTLTVEGGQNVNSGTAGLTFYGATTLSGSPTFNVTNPISGGSTVLTLTGSVGGSGYGITKTGNGQLNLTANNTYTGTTNVSGGTLSLSNANNNNIASSSIINIESGATLNTTGLAGVNDLILANGQTLKGEGTVVGNVTVASSSTMSPGTSPGTINHTGDVTYAGGGNYLWEINDTTGVVGTNWDLQNITGALNITATSSSKFNININSLTAGNVSGNVPNFDKYSNYVWTITSTTGGVSGFATSSFNLNTTNFINDVSGTDTNGYFSIQLSGNDLQITYTGAVDTIYTLNYAAGSNGTITGSTTQSVIYGSDGTEVTAIPDLNYHFVDWSDGATSTSRTDLNVIADISVIANFEINQYTLTFDSDGGTTVSSITQDYGTSITPPTTPTKDGYTFTGWSPALPATMSATSSFFTALWDQNQTTRRTGTSLAARITNLENMGNQQEAQRLREQYGVKQINTAQSLSISQLINLLISLDIITGDNVIKAKQLIGTLSNSNPTNQTFTQNLERSSSHPEVLKLQNFLTQKGYMTVTPNGHFGPATESALIQFQKDNNISPAIGYFGPVTRSFVNGLN